MTSVVVETALTKDQDVIKTSEIEMPPSPRPRPLKGGLETQTGLQYYNTTDD